MPTAVVNFSAPHQPRRRFSRTAAAAFGVVIFLVFVGFWMRDSVVRLMTKEAVIEPSRDYPRLSPQLEKNLADSFSTTFEWQSPDIFDPYKDRAGLDGKTAASVSGGATTSTPANMPNLPAPNLPAPSRYRVPLNLPAQINPMPGTNPAPIMPENNRTSGTKDRVEQAERDARYSGNNHAGNSSELYEVEDVEPLGIVGDQKSREILFYNPQTKRTVPVRQGQRFFNGRFVAVTEEGVVIENDSGTKVVKNWVRDRKAASKSSNSNPQLDVDFEPKREKSASKP